MTVWALADPHLALAIPQKTMDVFGGRWVGYVDKMKKAWEDLVKEEDLVLIAGDISWASNPADAKVDLEWIHALPGTKVMIKGNHDYWWDTISKALKVCPPSIHLIQNNSFTWNGVTIGGARLWDSDELDFDPIIEYVPVPENIHIAPEPKGEESRRVFDRELLRLEMSLKTLDPSAHTRIAMTHYPPIGYGLQPSTTAAILEKYRIDFCIFGHLHNVKQGIDIFGERNGVKYLLTSSDYLNFIPLKIL